MLADKKVLGVCVTKINDRVRGDFLDQLNQAALKAGYKLVCFNSVEDFYIDNVYSVGARYIYERIDYSIIDGLIICAEHFYSEQVIDEIVDRAKQHSIPVVMVNGEKEGCFTVENDCHEALREMVRHLVDVHQVRDSFFIAGRKENDQNSRDRLQVYREVLEEKGIPFSEDRVAYGEYWEGPPLRITQELADSGKMPQAIVCANDSMAFAVCRKLRELGYRVPEDVIVTGFDGIPAVDYFYPKLSTCQENRTELAGRCVEVFQKIFAEEEQPVKMRIPYAAIYSESCGCCKVSDGERKHEAAKLYRFLEEMDAHEDYTAAEANHMLNIEELEDIFQPLSRLILQNSLFCINSDFIRLALGKMVDDELTAVVPCYYDENRRVTYIPNQDMLPDLEGFAEDNSCYILTAIYSKERNCGYFAVRTDSVSSVNYKMKKIARYANLVFNSLINQFQQRQMMRDIENAGYIDSITGLPNLKGVTRWFEEFSEVLGNHRKTLAVSVYAIPQYTYIYENFGIREIEEVSVAVAEMLKTANPKDSYIAKIAENEFIVINYFTDSEKVGDAIQTATGNFFPAIDEYNRKSGKDYFVEVNAGCTVAGAGWDGKLEVFIRFASGEMFLNRLKRGKTEVVKENVSHKDYYSVFNLLIDNNLFTYHFQPIVDAKTGEIYAYEALMRTSGGINLSPLDVLDIAKEYKRLDEIEHATLFNVMRRYAEEFQSFKGRRVFINTIPNHFLSTQEIDELTEKYHDYFDYFVFEVTEQESSSDEEVEALKRLCGENGQAQIAVDDYGTGHSNIVNLLRYSPQIIKIDRFLISGVDSDTNKQMFVKNTIEFAAMNNIKVLAEGVETEEELRTVIGYGVDLIQGYYTGRPAPAPVEQIADEIRDEIIGENLRLSRYRDNQLKIYTARDGERLNLVSLALENYNCIHIAAGEVTFVGKKDCTLDIITKIADNANVRLILQDCNVCGTTGPAIQLGQGSDVNLDIRGFNAISKSGIQVTKNSRLRLTGDGALLVNCNQNDGVGIGAKYEEPYGAIIFEHTGRVKITSSGERLVSIGGGTSSSAIEIRSGLLELVGSGIAVVGIGSTIGDAEVLIGEAKITAKVSANESVGIGAVKGRAKVVSRGNLNIVADGERSVAIGSLFGKEGEISLLSGEASATVHCDEGVVIGAGSGYASVICDDCRLTVLGEGASVTGIGSRKADGSTEITDGIVDIKVMSGNGQLFGNAEGKVVITGGNVICVTEDGDVEVQAVNTCGQKLHRYLKEGDCFEQVVKAGGREYVYKAKRSEEKDMLSVYLP